MITYEFYKPFLRSTAKYAMQINAVQRILNLRSTDICSAFVLAVAVAAAVVRQTVNLDICMYMRHASDTHTHSHISVVCTKTNNKATCAHKEGERKNIVYMQLLGSAWIVVVVVAAAVLLRKRVASRNRAGIIPSITCHIFA